MKNIVIAGYVRSPFTLSGKGALSATRPDELAGQIVRSLVERTGVDADDIEDLILGCAFPEGEQGLNMARMVGFMAELPQSVAGVTVNRFCGSSMYAVHMAAGAIAMDAGEAFICASAPSGVNAAAASAAATRNFFMELLPGIGRLKAPTGENRSPFWTLVRHRGQSVRSADDSPEYSTGSAGGARQ